MKLKAIVSIVLMSGCIERGPSQGPAAFPGLASSSSGNFKLTQDIGVNAVIPAHQKLERSLSSFVNQIDSNCEARADFENIRLALQNSFKDVIFNYHVSEPLHVGKMAQNNFALRSQFYAWRSLNIFRLNIELAKKSNDPSYQIQLTDNFKGIPGIEYLLFEKTFDNGCQDCEDPMLAAWNKLPKKKKWASRCSAAKQMASVFSNELNQVTNELDNEKDFTLSSVYKNHYQVLTKFISESMYGFYFFDKEVRDIRVGAPSGINFVECGFDSCPELSEHRYSGQSIAALKGNLVGLYSLFRGAQVDASLNIVREGGGFYQWLITKGHGELARELDGAIRNSFNNLNRLSGQTVESLSLNIQYNDCKESTVNDRKVEICAIYQDLKLITDLYKNRLLLAVDLGRPRDQGGDAD